MTTTLRLDLSRFGSSRFGRLEVRLSAVGLLGGLAAAALLQGCAPQPQANAAVAAAVAGAPVTTVNQITVDGVSYPNANAALAGHQSKIDQIVAQMPPQADPIVGRVRIVLPDRDRLRPFVSQISTVLLKRAVLGDALEFFDSEMAEDLHEQAAALVKSGTFQSATIEEQNDVTQPADNGADYVVWFQVRTLLPNNTGAWVGAWQIKRRGNTATAPASADPGTAVGVAREESFVKSVHDASLRLGGRTVSGKTASSLPANTGVITATKTGSGIIINKSGEILTNAHVANGCNAPKVVDGTNARYSATLVRKDDANDLAVLRADHHWTDAASFRDGSEIRPGETIVATGFPLTGLVSSSMVVTTGSVSALTGPRDDFRMMQISAPVQPGNSGGPALDSSGHVVGVVTSILSTLPLMVATGSAPQNVNFATKSSIARNFLETQNIEFTHTPSTRELSSADVGAEARKFTVRIECGP